MTTPVVLKSLIQESKDGEWGKGEPFDHSVEMAVIRGTDFDEVRAGVLANLPIRYIPRHIAARKVLKPNDIVFETAGGSKAQPTGRSLFIKQSLVQSSELPLMCASFSRFIRIDPSKANPNYTFWHLQYLYEAGYIRQYHTQHTGVARFQYTVFSETEQLNLPTLSIQRKIAAILSAYDDLIQNNAQRIAILEEIARSLYREWFIEFHFPGHEQVQMADGVPEGWEVKGIGEVVNVLGGGTPSTQESRYWDGGKVTWFSPSDLTAAGTMFIADSSKKITDLGLQKSSARLFPAYSVMMTSRATIGVTAINTTEACTNQGFITCIPNEQLSAYQIYFWLNENREKIIGLASGATFKEINKTTFRGLPITIADEDTRTRFVYTLHPVCQQIENLQTKNANLRRTRDLLLPRLISGELDVSELEIAGAEALAEVAPV
jgi:type I restriction enzyme, S subunit